MNAAVSIVLAAASILSTFMLQLGDENDKAGLVVATSLFSILGALYFVDYKKTFSIPKFVANILMLLVVFSNLAALLRSRQEFLAFSIANMLVFIEAIIFYRKKTIRISYQILTISFVKVAVGCVFQRSGLFALLLPLYGISAFCCFSLLLLESEKKYYSKNVKLSPRFDARDFRPLKEEDEEKERKRAAKLARKTAAKKSRRLSLLTTPTLATISANGTASTESGVRFALLTEPTKFFSSTGVKSELGVDFDFFRHFMFASFGALTLAAVFFCLFPRFHRLEIGGIEFGRDGWNAGKGAARATTGFSSRIELGELGPAVDNPTPILSIRFVDLYDPKRSPVSPYSVVYLRGTQLARYSDRAWEQVDSQLARTNNRLRQALESSEPLEPTTRFREDPRPNFPGDSSSEDFPRGDPRFSQSRRFQQSLAQFHRTPTFSPTYLHIPTTQDLPELPELERVRAILPPENELSSYCLFDSRSRLVGTEIVLEPLDSPVLFAVSPFYTIGSTRTTFYFVENVATRVDSLRNVKTTYRFATNAFQNGIQSPLTPNQFVVWPYLDQYLELDVERFPKLIALARRWDAESNLPKTDFVGRARFLESKLRDAGEFLYDRNGVERNPKLDPLEDFVSEHKAGHCEYFAGALALMLRAIGIPSQTVVGLAFTPKDGGEKTVVRQSDAHSWTEAFIPFNKLPAADSPAADLFPGNVAGGLPEGTKNWPQDGAWLRLDATPASRLIKENGSLVDAGAAWIVFFQTIWRDYVLNFNGATQTKNIYRPIIDCWKTAIATIRDFRTGFHPFAAFVDKAKEIATQFRVGDWSPRAVGNALWFFAKITIALYLVVRLVVFFRTRQKRRSNAERKRRRPDAEKAFSLYRRVEKALARRLVVERRPDETPREFVERCFALEDEIGAKTNVQETKIDKNKPAFSPTSDENRRIFQEIVERYYRTRFGEVALSAEETARWNAALQEIGVD